MLYNAIVIGAGQLGSRHLQSLLKSKESMNVYVIDPSESSLAIARERAIEIDLDKTESHVYFSTNYEKIPLKIDFGVIATTAQHRASSVEKLLSKTVCKYLILEKVLFQNDNDVKRMQKAIDDNGTQVWVNCPRRLFQFYKEIKKYFSKNEKIIFSYDGGNWGLACNSVHMLDLVSYLNEVTSYEVNTDYLKAVLPSKRSSVKEVAGRLIATQKNGTEVHLLSDPNFKFSPVIRLAGSKASILVFETDGYAMISTEMNGWTWEKKEFTVKYQSELTHIVFENIVNSKNVGLTPFDESVEIHSSFIESLTEYFKQNGVSGCPIT